jgi:hypothetical protein
MLLHILMLMFLFLLKTMSFSKLHTHFMNKSVVQLGSDFPMLTLYIDVSDTTTLISVLALLLSFLCAILVTSVSGTSN